MIDFFNNILHQVKLCGIMFYPLSACFILSFAIFFDKIITYKKYSNIDQIFSKFFEIKDKNIFEIEVAFEAKKIEKKLISNLWILETVITASPLFGLLGTIIGMMQSFKSFGIDEAINTNAITAGISESLIATAYGLIIAIFSLFFFNYFSSKKDVILDDIESKISTYKSNGSLKNID